MANGANIVVIIVNIKDIKFLFSSNCIDINSFKLSILVEYRFNRSFQYSKPLTSNNSYPSRFVRISL